jgi:IS30 family transposase
MGKYRHLTPEDREQIGVLRAAGFTMCAIASLIGKSPSTISCELRRNTLDSGRYSANVADGAYMERRQRSAILEQDEKLAAFVRQRLSEGWSPQQISGFCRKFLDCLKGSFQRTQLCCEGHELLECRDARLGQLAFADHMRGFDPR